MAQDLFSSLDAFASSAASSLLVQEDAGQYRPAADREILKAAQRLLAAQVRGTHILGSPSIVKGILRTRLGTLQHEIFAIIHLDSQHRVLEYVEIFRGAVRETSVYPREIVKDALARSSSAMMLVHNHPSGSTEPSRADEAITRHLKNALALVDVRVLDHFIVAGDEIVSLAERGLV